LPDQIPLPLSTRFQPGISLRGAGPAAPSGTVGDHVSLTLYWQAEDKTAEPVTAFVHLIDESGSILAQIDRWPAGLPSNTWARGQVIVDEYELPIPVSVQPGKYRLAVGLYDANTGSRLPAQDAEGRRILDDRVILPFTVEIEP